MIWSFCLRMETSPILGWGDRICDGPLTSGIGVILHQFSNWEVPPAGEPTSGCRSGCRL